MWKVERGRVMEDSTRRVGNEGAEGGGQERYIE